MFDSAKAEVAQRIKPVEGEEVEWSITPSYTLAVSGLHTGRKRDGGRDFAGLEQRDRAGDGACM